MRDLTLAYYDLPIVQKGGDGSRVVSIDGWDDCSGLGDAGNGCKEEDGGFERAKKETRARQEEIAD